MGEESKEKKSNLQAVEPVRSFFVSSQYLVNKIVDALEKLDWDACMEYTIDFKSIVISNMLIKDKDPENVIKEFDRLIDIYGRPFMKWGNKFVKQNMARKQLQKIIHMLGKYGMYIGQETIEFENLYYAVDTILFDVNRLLPYALSNIEIRNEIVTKLEFLKNGIVSKMDMPDKLLLKVIHLINKVQTLLPSTAGGTFSISSNIKDIQQSFEELRTFLDFAKLIDRKPELKEQVEKMISSEGKVTKETIEKIASTVFDKKIQEFEVKTEEEVGED